MTKRFNLILEENIYEEWVRYYGTHGLRQAILRKVVWIMVNTARIRDGKPKPPAWRDGWESMTLEQLVSNVCQTMRED